jgi:hypothetical protein
LMKLESGTAVRYERCKEAKIQACMARRCS